MEDIYVSLTDKMKSNLSGNRVFQFNLLQFDTVLEE